MPLDIGVGILLSLLVSHWFGVHATPALVAFGILSALLPDIDVLPFLWPTPYNHRSFFHYPILYAPAAALVYLWAGKVYVLLFSLCVLAHFVHDTLGLGWGIAWLAPLSPRKFLFPEKLRRRKYGFYMTWLPQDESAMARRYHNPNWVQDYYLRPNVIAYVEYGVLLIALVALYFYARS